MAPTRTSRLGSLTAKRTTQLLVMAALLNMTLPTCVGLEQMPVLSGGTMGRRLADNSTDEFGAEVIEHVPTKDEAEEQEKSAKLNLPSTAAEDRLFQNVMADWNDGKIEISIDSIDPEAGPTTGETRVLVRGENLDKMKVIYKHPKCRFGSKKNIVAAEFVGCSESPQGEEDFEGKHKDRNFTCIQCDNAPLNEDGEGIVPFSVSFSGDFSDTHESFPYRYYEPTVVEWIYPRYGLKDGDTKVEVHGKNFHNFADHLRCNFGSRSTVGRFVNSEYLICTSPPSDVVGKRISFSISMNKQQNSVQLVDYWYYNMPLVSELIPNFGPYSGNNTVHLKGANFDPFHEFPDVINNHNDTRCRLEKIGDKYEDAFGSEYHDAFGFLTITNSTNAYCVMPENRAGREETFMEISLNNQQYTDDNNAYYYYKQPKIYDVEPKSGPTRGGTISIVTGQQFKTNLKILCQYGTKKTKGKLIGASQVMCKSPVFPTPGPVSLRIVYEGAGEKLGSDATTFTYYETPIVDSIDPPCGPNYGYTQITVSGKHFVETGFGKAKCVFNQTHFMNATIVDTNTMKCSTPKLSMDQAGLAPKHAHYIVQVTLNERDFSDNSHNIQFDYYPDPHISGTKDANVGPTTGGTTSNLTGIGFQHPNVCRLRVRYGALETTPTEVLSDSNIKTTSPRVNVPDAVVLAPSGNGQQYADDVTLHYRDVENTFTYHQESFIHILHPQYGPDSGNTKIEVSGIGFKQFKHEKNQDDTLNARIFAKFTNKETGDLIGQVQEVTGLSNDQFFIYSPAATQDTEAIISISYNKQDWQKIIPHKKDHTFAYVAAPKIHSIYPKFGPVKATNRTVVIRGDNFVCPKGDCQHLTVRFGDAANAIHMNATLIDPQHIRVNVPKYTKPDVLNVEISTNGEDFTNDKVSYGFFDPFLINVSPRLIQAGGGDRSQLKLSGFGFVNTTDGAVKVKFSSRNKGELTCNGVSPCTLPAKFLDKNTISSSTLALAGLTYTDTGNPVGVDPITVEVAVYDDVFTENKIQVYYYKAPEFKSLNKASIPNNIVHPILIDTNFHWKNNDVLGTGTGTVEKTVTEFGDHSTPSATIDSTTPSQSQEASRLKNEILTLTKHQNMTCRYSLDGKSYMTKATMEKLPLGSKYDMAEDSETNLPTHMMCPSPKIDHAGNGKMDLSINGMDFHGNFDFVFTEPLDVYRINPTAGPMGSHNRIRMIGSGYKETKEAAFAKFGTVSTQRLLKKEVTSMAWNEVSYMATMDLTQSDLRLYKHKDFEMFESDSYDSIEVMVPDAPPGSQNKADILGGPIYVSVGQKIKLNNGTEGGHVDQDGDALQNAAAIDKSHFIYSNSMVEYYYYKEPVVRKVEPTSGVTDGGTPIEISGAWFDSKIEYGVVPHCKIGDKIVRATFVSTVRIVCTTPPNTNTAAWQSIKVSLNGVNWVDTGAGFAYYTMPEIASITPRSGKMDGGQEVYLFAKEGSKFTNITAVHCKFEQVLEGRADVNHIVFPKITPAFYINENTMMCASLPGFSGGDQAQVSLTYNGQDFTKTSADTVFSFYSIHGSFPRSGPSSAGPSDVIQINGAGFKPNGEVICQLNVTQVPAVEVTATQIKCPMEWPNHDPNVLQGTVKFSAKIEGGWVEFGDFYYYPQIEVTGMSPKNGPAEGRGIIYFYGSKFDDFKGSQIGCKVGDAVGPGEIIEKDGEKSIKCSVAEMDLVNQGDYLPATVALNSYSWPKDVALPYVPYGIVGVFPSSGPYSGFTDILIQGKGFTDELAKKAKCRFGTDSNYAITDAEVIDYTKLVCRSPANFHLPQGADQRLSVPIGISFGDEEFKPWTEGLNRFRFYTNPKIKEAIPQEVKIGRMAEIMLIAEEDSPSFFETVPTAKSSKDQFGILCNFEEFGHSMGMYINETALLCVSPRVPGDPTDYHRETVLVTVAMNGQDFDEIDSAAHVTFVGTGSDLYIWKWIIAFILVAMILLAAGMFCGQLIAFFRTQSIPGASQGDSYKPTFTAQRRSKPERHTVALRVEESRSRRGVDQSLPGAFGGNAFGQSPPGSSLLQNSNNRGPQTASPYQAAGQDSLLRPR